MNTATVSQAQLLLQYLFALEILDSEVRRPADPRPAPAGNQSQRNDETPTGAVPK